MVPPLGNIFCPRSNASKGEYLDNMACSDAWPEAEPLCTHVHEALFSPVSKSCLFLNVSPSFSNTAMNLIKHNMLMVNTEAKLVLLSKYCMYDNLFMT